MQSGKPVWSAIWVLLPQTKGHCSCLLIKKQEDMGGGRCTHIAGSRQRGSGQQPLRATRCLLRSCDVTPFCNGSTWLPCLAPAQPGHNLAQEGVEWTSACCLDAAAFI